MAWKRKLSPHQRQLRFFTLLFGAVLIGVLALAMWLLNWLGSPHP